MSGHSKWSTIKHKKAAKDAKRGKMFTKLIREITVAARLGNSGDPNFNPRLRTAIIAAKAASMPSDNIDRAIKKGVGGTDGTSFEDITYEGYGPGGVAILVHALTDNRNRTVADVRGRFTKHGGSLGETGCVNWMFHRKGVILVEEGTIDEERLMELALDAGADDVGDVGGAWEVVSDPESFEAVREALEGAQVGIRSAEIAMLPENTVRVEGPEAEKLVRLIDALEDSDDVQSVSANADFDEEELAQLAG
jgi:YebC/PmpR family DNA-binding regulatory protein